MWLGQHNPAQKFLAKTNTRRFICDLKSFVHLCSTLFLTNTQKIYKLDVKHSSYLTRITYEENYQSEFRENMFRFKLSNFF